jgi:hypothetical protein
MTWTLRRDSPEGTLLPAEGARAASLPASRDSRRRVVAALITSATCLYLGWDAVAAVHAVGAPLWGGQAQLAADAMVLVPAIALVRTVLSPDANLPLSIYWAWSFVFMGLAPAHQLAANRFPWLGHFSVTTIERAQILVLVGHVCVLAAVYVVGRRRRGRSISAREHVDLVVESGQALGRTFDLLAYAYTFIALTFIALMGSSLFQARANFRMQLLQIADLPFGATLYFLAAAGAIAVPAATIAAHRNGVPVTRWAFAGATLTGAVVTNPLLGSRFLTGSFLVACAAAWLGSRNASRLLPAASIFLLVTLFPTLDTLRGDGSGSARVEFIAPAASLVSYDFDAFEMLAREVSLTPADRERLPDSLDLALAPVFRWVPVLAQSYSGLAGGAVVAEATGLDYTNVSMPLWGEGHLAAGMGGTIVALGALGTWLGVSSSGKGRRGTMDELPSTVVAPATAALMFIVLRGSLYEVLGYMGLIVGVYFVVRATLNRRAAEAEVRT